MGYGNGYVVEALIDVKALASMSGDDFLKMVVEPMLAKLNQGFKPDDDDKMVVFRMFARGMTQGELDLITAEQPTDPKKVN